MSETNITLLLRDFRTGRGARKQEAAAQLWRCYEQQMQRVARKRLAQSNRAFVDEEDVAVSAFRSFCHGIDTGKFDSLVSRGQLWSLLARLTANKAVDWIRYQCAQKRNGSVSLTNHLADHSQSETTYVDLLELVAISPEPTAEQIAQSTEQVERLIEMLSDAALRKIVDLKVQGFTNDEIARQMGCVTRTIERKLKLVRQLWGNELRN